MATTNEYAAFSAYVYNDQRGGGSNAASNKLPVPPGWKELSKLGNSSENDYDYYIKYYPVMEFINSFHPRNVDPHHHRRNGLHPQK